MAGGVGVLGAEGGTEGVNVGKRHGVRLDGKLSRNGERRLFAEEVGGIIKGEGVIMNIKELNY